MKKILGTWRRHTVHEGDTRYIKETTGPWRRLAIYTNTAVYQHKYSRLSTQIHPCIYTKKTCLRVFWLNSIEIRFFWLHIIDEIRVFWLNNMREICLLWLNNILEIRVFWLNNIHDIRLFWLNTIHEIRVFWLKTFMEFVCLVLRTPLFTTRRKWISDCQTVKYTAIWRTFCFLTTISDYQIVGMTYKRCTRCTGISEWRV